ncbi:hypothetical protein ABZP36_020143 [Zizania latifolia]
MCDVEMFAFCTINVEPIEAWGRCVWYVEAAAAAAIYGPGMAGLSHPCSDARVRRFYPGGFEREMTRREAALILGVRERTAMDKIKEAHKRVMVANHPDAGGSHYVASKINEAKELLMGKGKQIFSVYL